MFKELGKLNNLVKEKSFEIKFDKLKTGINFFENFIIYENNGNIRIYDRICDHAGGKIISKGNETVCPIHNWKFIPETGCYENGVKKREVNYSINENTIKIKTLELEPKLTKLNQKNSGTKIRYFNHAFLKIFGKNFSFATDPWAIGPAFNTGWWLKHATKNDWVDHLNSCSFVYISHNHPDHLHPLTLSKINKDIPIVVPKFLTDSTGKYVEELGFNNIYRIKFNTEYNLENTKLVFSLLKSGDFREDSGIYFSNGEFTGLLSVDSNMLNFARFPNVDFYAGSFAGGASGYPLMFENFASNEQVKIAKNFKNILKNQMYKDLAKIKPKYFMPYAGFFEEKLKRDQKIKNNNQKNSIQDYATYCENNNIKLLDVLKNDVYEFIGEKLKTTSNVKQEKTQDLSEETYLNYFKNQYENIDLKYIKNYFIESAFKDNLQLYIFLTNDEFKLLGENYLVDFRKNAPEFKKISCTDEKKILRDNSTKKLILKTRKESFLNTVYNKLPWEDLSIGFQCQVLRNPNVYNKDFWHHFTNIYTTSKNVRSVTNCGACTNLTHFFDNELNEANKNI